MERTGTGQELESEIGALACIERGLSEAGELLLRWASSVVPTSLRRMMLRLVHSGHQCWEKTSSFTIESILVRQ